MELSERKLKILQAIIDDFIYTAEPIGSRTISKKYRMGISPATIRNEMSDLEELGYLTHPHTSAGRVPSDKAYRLYVDYIMKRETLPEEQQINIRSRLDQNLSELDKTIERAANILSEITNLTAFALTPKTDTNKLQYINLIPVDDYSIVLMLVTETGKITNTILKIKVPYDKTKLELLSKVLTYNYKGKELSNILTVDIVKSVQTDIEAMNKLVQNIIPEFLKTLESMLNVELYMDGITNIFSIPEYNDIDKAKMFIRLVKDKGHIADLLDRRADGTMITIGKENPEDDMKDCSLITATYRVDGKFVGKLGVIGPTRMEYDKVTSVIEFMTDNLSRAFKITDNKENREHE